MRTFTTFAVILPFVLGVVADVATCAPGKLCPSSAPCCSEYGFCGTGHFCLGGCNPLWSNTLTSCAAAPVCKDAVYDFQDTSRIQANATIFDGNSTLKDWIVEGGSVTTSPEGISLVLTEKNNGTKISLTHFVHYGTITATMKTGKWKGVVTAFITMSGAKDEIDWEWPGTAVTEAQTNFFWLGVIPDYAQTHGTTVHNLTDTSENFHDYTIDWQKDNLRFLIDGVEVRNLERSSTANSAANGRMEYPTTPARVQFSLWPAGIPGSGQGTIDWAGGMIDWTDPYYVANGQYQTTIKSVSVKCADATSLAPGQKSYIYAANDTSGIPTIVASNSTGVLGGAGRRANLGSSVPSVMLASLAVVGGFAALML